MADSYDHDREWADRQQRSLEREERVVPSPLLPEVCISRMKVILPRLGMISQLGVAAGMDAREIRLGKSSDSPWMSGK